MDSGDVPDTCWFCCLRVSAFIVSFSTLGSTIAAVFLPDLCYSFQPISPPLGQPTYMRFYGLFEDCNLTISSRTLLCEDHTGALEVWRQCAQVFAYMAISLDLLSIPLCLVGVCHRNGYALFTAIVTFVLTFVCLLISLTVFLAKIEEFDNGNFVHRGGKGVYVYVATMIFCLVDVFLMMVYKDSAGIDREHFLPPCFRSERGYENFSDDEETNVTQQDNTPDDNDGPANVTGDNGGGRDDLGDDNSARNNLVGDNPEACNSARDNLTGDNPSGRNPTEDNHARNNPIGNSPLKDLQQDTYCQR